MKDPKIIERIKKLLALSLSDNPHEAQLASERLVELMNKYGISETDLDNNPFTTDVFESKKYHRLPDWVSELWAQLGHVSGCYITWVNGYVGYKHHSRKARITIAGRKADVDIVRYLGELYESQIFQKCEDLKKSVGAKAGRVAIYNKYKLGLAHGVVWRILKSQEDFFAHHQHEDGSALVPIDIRAKEAKAWHEEDGMKAKTVKQKDLSNDPAFLMGVKDSKSVQLNHGLGAAQELVALPNLGAIK